MNSDFIIKMNKLAVEIPALIKRLPGIAKVEGLNFIHDNFDKEGFERGIGRTEKWKARKPKKGKDKRQGRQILADSGALRRSWDNDSSASGTAAVFSSSLPYAGVHNDGLKAGRPPGFTMPERKMIGDSEALFGRIENKVDRMVDEMMK